MTLLLPALETALSVAFRHGGQAQAPQQEGVPDALAPGAALLGVGWSMPELEYTWTVAERSTLHLPLPGGPGDFFLQMRVTPFLAGRPQGQRLRVIANGFELIETVLDRTRTLTLFLPAEVFADNAALDIELQHADAVRVRDLLLIDDPRRLAVALHFARLLRVVERLSVPPTPDMRPPASDRDLLACFEGVGETPAFGFVQRRHGADPLGLLRFSDVSFDGLVDLVEARFANVAEAAALTVGYRATREGVPEYLLSHTQYRLVHHTLMPVSEMDEARMLKRETARLTLAARRLLQTLEATTAEAGDKILVLRTDRPLADDALIPLVGALTAYGRKLLLWVVDADAEHAPGTVEPLMDGLLRGYVAPGRVETRESMAEDGAAQDGAADPDGWLAVCRAAWLAWRAGGAAGGIGAAPFALVDAAE